MSYCTREQLIVDIPERTITQLSNDDPQATTPNWEIVDKSIQYAGDLVNGFLRSRYTLPLASFDTLLTIWTTAIARYRLYSRRAEGKELPPTVVANYDDAIASLKLVQNGKLNLGVGSLGTGTGTTGTTGTGDAIGTVGDMQPEVGQIRIRSGVRMFASDRLNQY